MELGENEIEGQDVQRSRSERDQGDEMEKVRETMIQTFRKLSVDLMEMYSLPRVTEEAKKLGLRTGAAMYLTIGRNFRRSRHRQGAKEYPERTHAQLIIGSLRCVSCPPSFRICRRGVKKKQRMWVEAKKRVEVHV